MPESSIVFAGLMPHAPVLVPGVGREIAAQAGRTVSALSEIAAHLVAARPDTVVVISPHSPRHPEAFGLWLAERLHGSFASFGATDQEVALPLDRVFASQLEREMRRHALRSWRIESGDLDHGATVPLFFLAQAGWTGPTVVIGLTRTDAEGCDRLGETIAATAKILHRRLAIVASGDMSHRLTPSAPAGFHPDAGRFDAEFIDLLRRDAPENLKRIDPDLVQTAAEDVVDPTLVALAATGYATRGHRVLSYEGPFGVGYGVAILFEPGEPPPDPAGEMLTKLDDLPAIARRAVAAGLENAAAAPSFRAGGELADRQGVFVTVRDAQGRLRGCRGTPEATAPDLLLETWRNAMASAFHDDRFAPVNRHELPRMHFTVTVLGPLEPEVSPEDLDPARYGVIVAARDGRRALLLPGIEGIETVGQQLQIVRQKAGIGPYEPIEIQRFTARSFAEPPNPAA